MAEFSVFELSAALRMRPVEARVLMANALDVRHRLPSLWRLVMAGALPVWQARRLATLTMELPAHEAGLVDLQLGRVIGGMSFTRIERLAEALVLEHLPVAVAEAHREAALDSRGVWIEQSASGVAQVGAVLDAPDGIFLDAQVERVAGILAAGGAGGGHDARRAKALGLLANPAAALDLLQASLLDELPSEVEAHEVQCSRQGFAGHVCGSVAGSVDPEALLPKASVVLHLTSDTLSDGVGPVRFEQAKPLLAQWLRDLFGAHRVTVRPVIDQNHQVPSDAYECPPTMREAVGLRNPFEVFPWSTRRSEGLDLDHTNPWRPPTEHSFPELVRSLVPELVEGHRPQTRPDNLGPLTRGVHRAKTHGGWHLQQPLPGYFIWQSPLGYRYLVTPSRTIDLGRPDAPAAWGDPELSPSAA